MICIPKWARAEKADLSDARRVVDVAFALGVSLHSSNYITEEDLRSFRLSPVDDDDNTSPPLVVPTLSVGMPPRLAANVTPTASSTTPPAATISVPQGKPNLSEFVFTSLCNLSGRVFTFFLISPCYTF